MAHQAPHPVQVEDDDANLSSPGTGESPRTLSFINNVQSAVAQIERRLATSPSAHPPPPSRHELPHTPPGPQDPVIGRVQSLESSLSIPSPKTSNSVSHGDSSFAGAINPRTSLVSSGVIISTTPRNTLSPKPSNTIHNHHTTQPQPQTPSPSVSDATDGGINSSVSTIGPIVEHFETPATPSFAKEQNSAIVAAPIAPIVEQFEASSQPVDETDNTQTIEASDQACTAPVTEQSDASVVDDKPVSSANTGSSDTSLELNASTFDNNQMSSGTASEPVESGTPAGSDIPAGVPTFAHPEQENATDEAALQTPSTTHEQAKNVSTAADEFAPVSVVDEVGPIADDVEHIADDVEHIADDVEHIADDVEHIADDVEHIADDVEHIADDVEHIADDVEHIADDVGQASGLNERADETDTKNTSVVIPPQNGESEATGTSPTCDIDQASQSFANVPDEETIASEEDTEALRTRTVWGDLSEDASPDITPHEGEAHVGHTSHETAVVAVSSARPGEEDEPQPSLDDGNSMPCEVDNATVMTPATANITVAATSQSDGEAGAPSMPLSTENIGCGEIETPENPPLQASVDPENLEVAVHASGSEFNNNEETLSAAVSAPVGDTKATENEGQSDNHTGKPMNITKTSEDDIHITPAIDSANTDESSVAEMEAPVRDAAVSGREQKASSEYKENRDLAQTSDSSPDGDGSSRNVVDTISGESASPDPSHEQHSPSEVAKAKPCELQEIPEEVATETKKFEEDGRLEESATDVQSSEQLSREGEGITGTEDGTAAGTNDTATSSMHEEPSTQTFQEGHHRTNEQETREVMAAKAVLARDKLAKFSLGSPVKKPHRSPFIRKSGETRESSIKAVGTAPVSPGIRRSPTSPNPKKSSFNRTKLTAESDTSKISAILEASFDSPKQGKLRSPSASSRETVPVLAGLTPRRSPVQKGRTLPPSENIPRLPRVAGLTPTRSASSRTHPTPKLRTRTKIPRAATFSATVPRSKPIVSSPVLGRKAGISSSPVTPSSSEKASNTPRPPLRRALSFTQSKPSSTPFSPLSRPASSRSRGSDAGSTLSLSASGSKPPRGSRPRFTVPEPFALAGPELQERSEKQMEEARRKAAEAELRPRVFKPRPMPDFSRPSPKPHK